MPFWLFCLRIHSSLNFIISDYNSYLDYKLKFSICAIINQRLKNNLDIGINWINLLTESNEKNIQDQFLNCSSNFISIIKKDKLLNEKLKNLGDEHPINKSIIKNINNLVNYCFDPQNFKQSLFAFFSDINEQIKAQLIKIIKNESMDYLVGGKILIQFVETIKR